MAPTWYVIVNPYAGKGKGAQVWNTLRNALDVLDIPYHAATSEARGHIADLSYQAALSGHTHFISIGGDGTHHEMINGILSARVAEPVIAIVNAGSGNDWSRNAKLSQDPTRIATALVDGQRMKHNAAYATCQRNGQAVSEYYMNVLGIGLDGRVVETFPERYRTIPILPGYLIAGIWHLLFYRSPELILKVNNDSIRQFFLTVNAGICKYSGGGMQFVPQADPSGPDLAITCVQRMPKLRLLANIYRLYNGTLLKHPRVLNFRSTQFEIASPSGKPVPVEADGEFLGYTPLSVRIIPGAFSLVTP